MGVSSAERRYRDLERLHEEAKAFVAHPDGGGFLMRLTHDHPLLFQEPQTQAAASDAFEVFKIFQGFFGAKPAPAERVIERQVVVTRCRFCRGMTPVDAPTCQHCGAPGFGG